MIGFLAAGSKTANARYYSSFPDGLRELGHVESRDYVFADRYAEGDVAFWSTLPIQGTSCKS